MVTKLRMTRAFVLLTALTVMAICLPLLGADEGGLASTAPDHVVGFFEYHCVLTELIVLPIFALLIAIAMASDTTTQRIKTEHWDFWNKPLGRSFTDIPVSKEPSSPTEIKNTLIVMGMIYLALRFTCLFGFFNGFYQLVGSLIDVFLH